MSDSKELNNKSRAKSVKQKGTKGSEPLVHKEDELNPVWFKPVMFGFMLVGLVWIVLYYVTSSTLALPIPPLGQNNIFVGFGLILVGFLMTTRWK